MLIRFWLRASGIMALISVLTVGMIVAQPRDDAAMRAFFAPADCSSPCFLGIHPGVTTQEQAVAILRAHPWVGTVNSNAYGLSWAWNGQQPAFVSGLGSGSFVAHIDFRAGVVSTITVATGTTWGEFLDLFGTPDREALLPTTSLSTHAQLFDAAYFKPDFQVEMQAHCQLKTLAVVWYSTVFITWPAPGLPLYSRREPTGAC